MTTILPTENTEWGFFGEMKRQHDELIAQSEWNSVFSQIAARFNEEPATVRRFLDSRNGRHLADGLSAHSLLWMFKNWNGWFAGKLAEQRNNSNLAA